MKKIIFLTILVFSAKLSLSQNSSYSKFNNKGKVFLYWGWNRDAYTHSDINFKGDEYNFTVKQAVAKDRPIPFRPNLYLNPSKMTIPQYNFRIGYCFNPKYSISFGFDHMKYVMKQNQTTKISGAIAGTNTDYDRIYNNEPVELTNDFLRFEHTNGLNYLNLELRRMDRLVKPEFLKIKHIDINLFEGVGAGFLYPKSDVALLNYEENDQWHLAGYGVNVVAGLNITFFKSFFIQGEIKGGFINMPNILTTHQVSDRAAQHFFFSQGNVNFGVMFKLL